MLTPSEWLYELKGQAILPLRLLSKSNFKPRGRMYVPKRLQDFEGEVAWIVSKAVGKLGLRSGWVVIRPHFETRIHPDLSNLPKSIIDGIVKGGVFEDDKLVAVTVTPAVYGDKDTIVEVWG